MINVVISGIYYPVTAALEYIVRAFKHREDCNVFTVGPYTGLNIPWTKQGTLGVVMPDAYDFKPDLALPKSGDLQNAPINYIENQIPHRVDLWVDVNAGFFLSGVPKSGVRTTFLTDPHVLRSWYDSIKPNYQFVFNPQRQYSTPGEYYLPYAADRDWHSPIDGLEKIYDVSLIGNTYAQRIELMGRLKAQGKRTFFELGPAKEDARKIYSQSIIGINWSSMQDLTARVFEISALGVVPIINRVPDLTVLFQEGVHYIGFDNIEQAEAAINNILANPLLAAEISRNARENIINGGHFWDNRVATILHVAGLV